VQNRKQKAHRETLFALNHLENLNHRVKYPAVLNNESIKDQVSDEHRLNNKILGSIAVGSSLSNYLAS
jgi:hypothetical protein